MKLLIWAYYYEGYLANIKILLERDNIEANAAERNGWTTLTMLASSGMISS
jgi:hypothetical protein